MEKETIYELGKKAQLGDEISLIKLLIEKEK